MREIVKYGEGSLGVGDELEGVGGVKAVVLHALVKEIVEIAEVSGFACGIDE